MISFSFTENVKNADAVTAAGHCTKCSWTEKWLAPVGDLRFSALNLYIKIAIYGHFVQNAQWKNLDDLKGTLWNGVSNCEVSY